MKFLKFLTFSTILTLSAHTYATVGGGQKIEVLGYQQKEKKLYVLRHYEDGRGRLPQLYYYLLNSKSPDKLIEVKSLYINPKHIRLIMIKIVQRLIRHLIKLKGI
ncbi:hypothetical protein BANRA_03739 [Acinetobacter baumannii]|nr:hypothetical protein BANRA_02581 [Acinetobacter baumannii]VDA21882.1 hypothetical protein BANRA_03739 [Acinetobacter baumannii]